MPTCSRCAKTIESKSGKTPRGWKNVEGTLSCGACWSDAYAIRAVVVPIAGPVVEGGHDAIEAAWDDLRARLHESWAACTRVANWAVRELAKIEPPRGEKLGKLPPHYLYPGACALAPEIAPTSISSLLQSVESRYSERRFAAIHRCAESLPSYRYPTPLPCHVQAWRLVPLEGGALAVSVQLGSGEHAVRVLLRLRGGHEYARQHVALRALLAGRARPCELAIYEVGAHKSDHRPGTEERSPGGAPRQAKRIVVKVVLWYPIEKRELDGTMHVRTSRDALLTWSFGEGKGDDAATAYRYNADHVRRWVAEHRNRLQRTSDDLKREKRWPKPVRLAQVEARAPWVEKFNHRMDSLTHEASAMIARVAERRHVARIVYDDSERGYVESFPWHALKEKIAYKAKASGIAFEESSASGEVLAAVAGPLADNEKDGPVEGSGPFAPPLGAARARSDRRARRTARGTLHKN